MNKKIIIILLIVSFALNNLAIAQVKMYFFSNEGDTIIVNSTAKFYFCELKDKGSVSYSEALHVDSKEFTRKDTFDINLSEIDSFFFQNIGKKEVKVNIEFPKISYLNFPSIGDKVKVFKKKIRILGKKKQVILVCRDKVILGSHSTSVEYFTYFDRKYMLPIKSVIKQYDYPSNTLKKTIITELFRLENY